MNALLISRLLKHNFRFGRMQFIGTQTPCIQERCAFLSEERGGSGFSICGV